MVTRRSWLITLLLVIAASPEVGAQGIARSFEQLRLLVREGDTVTVRQAGGEQATGRIDGLSSSTLRLLISEKPREFQEADVNAVLQRKGDSLANGALWGFLAGAGIMGGIAVAMCSGCESNDTPYQVGLGVLGALTGLGVGIGVDAFIARSSVIYQRPASPSAFRMTPLLGKGQRGVEFSLRY